MRRRLRRRRELARRYLRGEGIEIGALHLPLELPADAHVQYVDRLPTPALREHYPELAAQPLVDVEIIDDGERLGNVPDRSQDFVIANHFLEHSEDPIRALTNMLRVLKPGGVLYLAVPDKRNTFDVNRPSTPLEHLIDDHEHGPERSRAQHYDEWARLVDGRNGSEAEEHARELEAKGYSIHFHVWTHEELLELYDGFRDRLPPHELELAVKNVDESVLILRSLA